MLHKILILLTVITLAAPSYAQSFLDDPAAKNSSNNSKNTGKAINPYNEKYRPQAKKDTAAKPKTNTKASLNMPAGSLIPSHYGKMAFHREGTTQAYTILLTPPVILQGCAAAEYGEVESKFANHKLEIKLPEITMALSKRTRHPQYECDTSGSAPTASVTFTKEQLEENETKQLIIKNASGQTTWNIELTEHYALFTPQDEENDHIKLWFLPENSVFLSIPGASEGDDIYPYLKHYASAHGLIEITNIIKNFEYQQSDLEDFYMRNMFVFVDPQGLYIKKLKGDQLEYVDSIQIPETFVGVGGPYEIQKKADIYAAKFKTGE